MCIVGLTVTSPLFTETIEARRWNEIPQGNTHFILSGDSFVLLSRESYNYWSFKLACVDTESETRSLMGIFAFYVLDKLLQIRPIYIYPIAIKAGSNTTILARVRYEDDPNGPDGKDIAMILVENGLARVDKFQAKEYCMDNADELIRAEEEAKFRKLGIWSHMNIFSNAEYGDETF